MTWPVILSVAVAVAFGGFPVLAVLFAPTTMRSASVMAAMVAVAELLGALLGAWARRMMLLLKAGDMRAEAEIRAALGAWWAKEFPSAVLETDALIRLSERLATLRMFAPCAKKEGA